MRALRRLGHRVEIQNYIDDTGVQVADVVVGLCRSARHEHLSRGRRRLPEPFDYTCWDLYSEVGRFYEEDPKRTESPCAAATLHELEDRHKVNEGRDGSSWWRGVSSARHLAHHGAAWASTMTCSTRESEILALALLHHVAFEKLKESGAIRKEVDGKNAGCWVMPLSQSAEFAGLEDPDKVIVRSDGTVTYVGKDIAYQLWKFGLLGRDFEYRRWDEEGLWETTSTSGGDGRARLRRRQQGDQRHRRTAELPSAHRPCRPRSAGTLPTKPSNPSHFAYEMVSLSKNAAAELGYLADGESGRQSLEMSGRKGIGSQGRRPPRPDRGQAAGEGHRTLPRSRRRSATRSRPSTGDRRPALLHGQSDHHPA